MTEIEKVYVDMDGVLCDFEAGIISFCKIVNDLSQFKIDSLCERDYNTVMRIKQMVSNGSLPLDRMNHFNCYEFFPRDFVDCFLHLTIPMGFFQRLPVLESGIDAVIELKEKYPYATFDVLSCIGKMHPDVVRYDKGVWLIENIRRHIIPLKIFHFTHRSEDKEFYATPSSLLIDDYDKTVERFKNMGGNAILFKRTY